MKRTVLLLLILCCTSLTSGVGSCHQDGTGSCYFKDDFCGWRSDNFIRVKGGDRPDQFLLNRQTGGEAKLTSQTACSTGGQTHCLRFMFDIDTFDHAPQLVVSIKYEGSDETETPLWIVTESNLWDYATVPIRTLRDFTVVITAKIRQNSTSDVSMDNIFYNKWPCPSGLYPPHAAPTPVTTTPTLPTTKRFSTTTTPFTTTWTQSKKTTETIMPAHSSTSEAPISNTPPALQVALQVESEMPLNKVGVIVGFVATIVVFSIIIIVLVVVIRRKLPTSQNPYAERRHERELSEQENEVYEVPDTPSTDNGHTRNAATATGQAEDHGTHQAAPPDGLRDVSDGPSREVAAANYDRLDFSDAENETRVYSDLHV